MIRCVIFDLDGTLLNTLEDLCDSTNFALAQMGYPQRSLEEVRKFVGNGVRKLIERAVPADINSTDVEKCLAIFKKHYSENMYNKTAPYNGIIKMLEVLKNNEIPTAVVSNKFDAAVKELCKKYFGNLIQIAIGENEAEGVRKKPAPDSVLKAMNELNVSRDDVIYVGDSETDVQTARNANINCIGCCWGFRSREVLEKEGAKYIVESPDEILRIVGV